MNPTTKAALLSLFTLTASQSQAQETTALAFSINACTQNQETLSIDIRTDVEVTRDSNESLETLLSAQTARFKEQLQNRFNISARSIDADTTTAQITSVFNQFYGEGFHAIREEYRENINAALTTDASVTGLKISTSDIKRDPNELCL